MFKLTQTFALLPLTVLVVSISCVVLNGCDEKSGEAASRAVKQFQRGLTADDRAAIQAVGKKLSKAAAELNSNPSTKEEFQASFKRMYETTQMIDVSACPEDFRSQFNRVIVSMGEFNDAVDNLPVDDDEQLAYFFSQFGSTNPDFEGKGVIHIAEMAKQDMFHQMSELKAVAHKYDADQGF